MMAAAAVTQAVTVREFLAQLCDDAAAYREPDRFANCSDCNRTMTGWCDRCAADDETARRYAALDRAVSAAADDQAAWDVFRAAVTKAGQP